MNYSENAKLHKALGALLHSDAAGREKARNEARDIWIATTSAHIKVKVLERANARADTLDVPRPKTFEAAVRGFGTRLILTAEEEAL